MSKTATKKTRRPARKPQPKIEVIETPDQGLATVEEGMRFLSIGRTKFGELMDDGTLKVKRIGRAVRVTWDSLHRFARVN